jgi:integrase
VQLLAPTKKDTPARGSASVNDGQVLDVFSNDRSAIEDWLHSKAGASPHSLRAYRQAVDHFWTWLTSRKGGVTDDVLITLRSHDAAAYFQDLLSPSRHLSAKTVKHRLTILSALYAYWLRPRDDGRRIVQSNPFDGMAAQVDASDSVNTGATRSLSEEEQSAVEAAIEALPRNTVLQKRHYHRARLIWLLASRLALRRAEIARLRVNDIKLASNGKLWKIEIRGKGRKDNQSADVVMVPDFIMDEIRSYRAAFDLHPHPLPSDSSFLVRHVNATRASGLVSDAHVARIMKTIFLMAAEHAEKVLRKPHLTPRLHSASIHWGRHTWFMNALKDHDLRLVSPAGRHRDIRTTMRSYVGTSESDLAKIMESGRPLRHT